MDQVRLTLRNRLASQRIYDAARAMAGDEAAAGLQVAAGRTPELRAMQQLEAVADFLETVAGDGAYIPLIDGKVEIAVEDLREQGLTAAEAYSLALAGIFTAEDIAERTEAELAAIAGIGDKAMEKIVATFAVAPPAPPAPADEQPAE